MKSFAGVITVVFLVVSVISFGCSKKNPEEPNNAPSTPAVPAGPSTGFIDSSYTFTSSATDPDGDSISIRFCWSNGDTSSWSSFVGSGDTVSMAHSYSQSGTFGIKAQAKDKNAAVSNWSDALQFNIPGAGSGWAKLLGGSGEDVGKWVNATSDGGYIIAGWTTSYGASAADAYLAKADSSGNELWHTIIGGPVDEWIYSACKTSDGGYVLTGTTDSYDPYWGSNDVYLLKADGSGNEVWHKVIRCDPDSSGTEECAYSVKETSDGGYILAGFRNNYDQDTLTQAYLVKTDASGDKLWDKLFGGSGKDWANSVAQTSDGGYIIAGATESFGALLRDVYLIKTDASGNESWHKTFGGAGYDEGRSVCETSDGGYILAGYINSGDIYLIKTDASGNELWSKTFGGTNYETAYSVQQTSDGGYIIAGITDSYGTGVEDVYLVKTDASGNELWSKTFGGADDDEGYFVQQLSNGGYIVVGKTQSPPASGGSDVYLIKTSD